MFVGKVYNAIDAEILHDLMEDSGRAEQILRAEQFLALAEKLLGPLPPPQ
jgi:hypothetical protein